MANQFTIATMCDIQWVKTHLLRFIRLGRRAMPDARFCVAIMHDGQIPPIGSWLPEWSTKTEVSKVLDLFDRVAQIKPEQDDDARRRQANRVRMQFCEVFDVPELLFIDADVDIYATIADVPKMNTKPVGWCMSPVMHQDWVATAKTIGYKTDKVPCANNGMLFLRGDCSKPYRAAERVADGLMLNPRIKGLVTFNIMLHENPEAHWQIPYHYGHIWWDTTTKVKNQSDGQVVCVHEVARTSHFCGDGGKQARQNKDSLWAY
jgi:hypothetical protein